MNDGPQLKIKITPEVILKNFLFIFLSFFSIQAIAQETKTIDWSKLGFKPKVKLLGMFKYQNATFGSGDSAVAKSRTMKGFGGDAIAGINFGPALIGLGGDYVTWFQSTDKADAGNSDLSGYSQNLYGTAGFAFSRLLILGKYNFQSTYKVKPKDASGQKIRYEDPSGSYSATLIYRPGGKWFFGVEYSHLIFTKEERGSTNTTLSGDKKMKLEAVGASLGMIF